MADAGVRFSKDGAVFDGRGLRGDNCRMFFVGRRESWLRNRSGQWELGNGGDSEYIDVPAG